MNTVDIQNDQQPVANAGPDQTLCNTSTFIMAAVPSVGTGMWTSTNSSISITTPTSATTSITGLAAGTSATLTWTETNGTCSDMNTVVIQNDQQPVANAGPDQTLCNTSTFTMAAVPSVGTGMWTTTNTSISITTPTSAKDYCNWTGCWYLKLHSRGPKPMAHAQI